MKRGPNWNRRRDFWRAWREEMEAHMAELEEHINESVENEVSESLRDAYGRHGHHRGRQHGPPWAWRGPNPPPTEINRVWREFFTDFTGSTPEDHWAFGGRRFSPWHQGIASFNPFVASLLSKGGGLLPLIVLQLLAEKPRYGNEIMSLLEDRTAGQWTANPGAIYPLMTMLEENGLITGEWEDPDKRTVRIYRLTETGERELPRIRAVVSPKLQEALDVLEQMLRDLGEGDAAADSSEMV